MKQPLSEEELREIERQLRCPDGDFGIKIAQDMNESNHQMTMESVRFLELQDGDSVLELGHGACGHLEALLKMAQNIDYHGLDISETMHKEAKESQCHLPATFKLYDGKNIPYEEATFDKIFTVNTIYFWEEPEKLLNELARVLKPNGHLVIAYAEKSFMKTLPFVADKFRLYDLEDIKKLAQKSPLKIKDTKTQTEQVISKVGELVERTYTMMKLKKE
ncbi:class I SAM-dependent methyltransferase [Riemerella columbina]|uniref:class I SAM-dependent methyltransferase n=1 Tax=Riemerella columbina TaxID=103810 RepID=UPI00036E20BF|nr:class I SAM-dependent methyltransferase [Riemerella columbina]